MTWKIPLFKIFWDENDVTSVSDVIKSGMSWAEGPQISQFETEIARYFNKLHCVTFNSGTSALHASLLAYGFGPGDEIIVPSFTFIATVNAVKFIGATPVFADIETTTCGLDPDDVAQKITSKTRAIIPIHYGGSPCKIKELAKIATDHDIILVEDAAEAFGAKIGSESVGTFGDSSLLSFCQNKIITTGEGGAIITDSDELNQKLKLIRSHGRPDTCDYFGTSSNSDYIDLGYNFRMSTMTAALGLSQLHKIQKIIDKRRLIANHYNQRIQKEIPHCHILDTPSFYYHVYQLYSIRASDRNFLMKFLEEKGIMTKIYFQPVHETTYYKHILKISPILPNTDKISKEILSLPIYPNLNFEDMDYILDSIKTFYEER